MPEPTGSEARLHALRRRWEAEKSTAFLPLAEEYRRLGRLRDAIDVLETGLRGNPAYTSGMVALGRCRLESGDPAAAAVVLERVVAQDPEQLVASKLLIDAYLRTGRAREARTRLDIYSSLNAKDPEIARLADRIQALGTPPPPEAPAPPLAATAALGVASPEIFEVERGPARPAPDLSRLLDGPAASSAPPLPPATIAAGSRLFQGLDGPVVVSRYLRGLSAEGLFQLVFPAAVPQPPAEPVAAEDASAPVAAASGLERLPDLEEALPRAVEGPALVAPEPVVETPAPAPPMPAAPEPVRTAVKFLSTAPKPVVEPFDADVERAISRVVPVPPAPRIAAPESAPPPPVASEATTTLGDLYLRQGHAAEAERIFGAVLGRDPKNDEARRGLDEAQERLRQGAGGLSARRAGALRDYLRRLTRREERHVP